MSGFVHAVANGVDGSSSFLPPLDGNGEPRHQGLRAAGYIWRIDPADGRGEVAKEPGLGRSVRYFSKSPTCAFFFFFFFATAKFVSRRRPILGRTILTSKFISK